MSNMIICKRHAYSERSNAFLCSICCLSRLCFTAKIPSMILHPLTLRSHGGTMSTMRSHVLTHAHAQDHFDCFECPMSTHDSGHLRRRGNVDNVAAAHDSCRPHAGCSQQGCMPKMLMQHASLLGPEHCLARAVLRPG